MRLFFLICLAVLHTAGSFAQNNGHRDQTKAIFKRARSYDGANADSARIYRDYIKEAMATYDEIGITSHRASHSLLIGISYFEENKLDSAITYLGNALEGYRSDPDDRSTKTQAYTFIIHAHRARGEHDLAAKYARELIDFAVRNDDLSTAANFHYILGAIYDDTGMSDRAVEQMQSGGELAAVIKDYDLAYRSYNSVSTVYNKTGRPDLALPATQKAWEYVSIAGDGTAKGTVQCSFAAVHYLLGDMEKTAEAYRAAMGFFAEAGNEQFYKLAESGLTFVMNDMGQKDDVIENVKSRPAAENITFDVDSLALPDSYQEMKMQLLTSNFNATDKKLKFDILQQDYLERRAATLRQRIWYISALAVMIILTLALLYNRERQKAKAEKMARYAEEKENQYLALQKETEARLVRQYIDGLESERERIARELHDGVCNDLLALEMQLKASPDGDKGIGILKNTRENVRSLSHELMPPRFQDATIDEMLSDYLAHLDLCAPLRAAYSSTEGARWDDIPRTAAFEAYRIVQEAVGNVVKHSGATHISVGLERRGDLLSVEISDNGAGFDHNRKNTGIGLRTMGERVRSVGGELSVATGAGGTTVTACFKI